MLPKSQLLLGLWLGQEHTDCWVPIRKTEHKQDKTIRNWACWTASMDRGVYLLEYSLNLTSMHSFHLQTNFMMYVSLSHSFYS